jgi:HK97 gp10 family phage protein
MNGLEIRQDNTEEVLDALADQVGVGLEKIGLVAEGYAKRLCPVDTGRLRNSITHTTDDSAAYIGTNVDYAVYVEMGTVRTPAQPYLKPAAADHADEYRRILNDALQSSE